MGLLRVFLALAVVAAHQPPPTGLLRFVGGQMAVEIFFVISGFYMQMVMASGRYVTARDFYISRALRIFPAYWLIAGVVLLASPGWLDRVTQLGLGPSVLLLLSNAILLLQDTTLFLSGNGGTLSFTANVFADPLPLHWYLLVPVAWTLALELYFYMLVPLLAKRSDRFLITLIAITTIARIVTYLAGLNSDPWTYRFFPFEIALFLCGMLAQRFHARTDWQSFPREKLSRIGWICLAVFCLSGPFRASRTAIFLLAMAWTFAIPYIFELTRRSRIDRIIGELSYPVYLVHVPLLYLVMPHLKQAFPVLGIIPDYFVLAALSLATAFAIWWLIDRPIDHLRHRMLVASDHGASNLNAPESRRQFES
ncbi:MAG: acyltransferase [Rhizobiales bacterium]|nr:acyltransferase [Hyphomicrobiales bacterium]